MKLSLKAILSASVLLLLFCCTLEDSNFEELKSLAAKETPMDIIAPSTVEFEEEQVPSNEPITEAESTIYNHYIENLSPKHEVIITFNGNEAIVSGDASYTKNGAHVTVTTSKRTLITLSGSTNDGSLTILPSNPSNKEEQYRCGVRLNGVSIKNPSGAAINSQLKKRLLVDLVPDTENSLESGEVTGETNSATHGKGCLFSEDKIVVSASKATANKWGKLTINSAFMNCIAADDYLIIRPNVNIILNANKCNGIKANDGLFVWGGQTSIFTEGASKINKVEVSEEFPNGLDTTSCAGVKTDSVVHIKKGLLQIKCTGDDAKGIKCDYDFTQDGGEVYIVTLALNKLSSPKGIKTDKNFVFNAGSFYSYSRYSTPLEAMGETIIKSTNIRKKSYLLEIK